MQCFGPRWGTQGLRIHTVTAPLYNDVFFCIRVTAPLHDEASCMQCFGARWGTQGLRIHTATAPLYNGVFVCIRVTAPLYNDVFFVCGAAVPGWGTQALRLHTDTAPLHNDVFFAYGAAAQVGERTRMPKRTYKSRRGLYK